MPRRAPSPARQVIQSEEECAVEAQEYIQLQAEIEKIEAERKEEQDQVTQKYAKRLTPLLEQREKKFARVQAWAESVRDGQKTIKLVNGRLLEWRRPSSPKLLVVGRLPTIVRLMLRRDDWEELLNIELRKEAVKKRLDTFRGVPGLRHGLKLDDTEYFRIR